MERSKAKRSGEETIAILLSFRIADLVIAHITSSEEIKEVAKEVIELYRRRRRRACEKEFVQSWVI